MMKNCIVIGDYAGSNLRGGRNIVLIGQRMRAAAEILPDNYVSIAGVFEGVIRSPEWPAAVAEFQDEMLMSGAPAALASLVEPFGIDGKAASRAAVATLNEIRRARNSR